MVSVRFFTRLDNRNGSRRSRPGVQVRGEAAVLEQGRDGGTYASEYRTVQAAFNTAVEPPTKMRRSAAG